MTPLDEPDVFCLDCDMAIEGSRLDELISAWRKDWDVEARCDDCLPRCGDCGTRHDVFLVDGVHLCGWCSADAE